MDELFDFGDCTVIIAPYGMMQDKRIVINGTVQVRVESEYMEQRTMAGGQSVIDQRDETGRTYHIGVESKRMEFIDPADHQFGFPIDVEKCASEISDPIRVIRIRRKKKRLPERR